MFYADPPNGKPRLHRGAERKMYHMLFKSWSCVVYFLYMLYKLLTYVVQNIFICCVRKFMNCPRNSHMLSNFLSYVV